MRTAAYRGDALLLVAACIWGTAFVAQRAGMEYVGPMTFSAVRFALGTLVLLPVALRAHGAVGSTMWSARRGKAERRGSSARRIALSGGLAGLVLFIAVSFQQFGLVYTTAGKAGFITGLYVVIVPFLGLFARQRAGLGTWVGVFLAAGGLYLLSVPVSPNGEFTVARGDCLVMVGAFFWALHVVVLGWLSPRMKPTVLACTQFGTCSLLSGLAALCTERVVLSSLVPATIPILYGGVVSVGIGYTLQVAGQRHAPPAHAAIILGLETVVAALAGWVILGEVLGCRGLVGCALLLAAMLVSQLTKPVTERFLSRPVRSE